MQGKVELYNAVSIAIWEHVLTVKTVMLRAWTNNKKIQTPGR